MAENKKSFVLYCDVSKTVNKLPDDKAGALFKMILAYVNDENPETDDLLVDVVFEPIKQQLKRDLDKYEKKKKQWSEAGKKSAEARKQKATTSNEQPTKSNGRSTNVKNVATVSTVNVNDTVNVNVNDTVNVSNTIDKRKRGFLTKTQEVFKTKYLNKGENDLALKFEAKKFFEYWTECNLNGKKMKFEKEKTFEIEKRVSRWLDNAKTYNQNKTEQTKKVTALEFAQKFN